MVNIFPRGARGKKSTAESDPLVELEVKFKDQVYKVGWYVDPPKDLVKKKFMENMCILSTYREGETICAIR